MATGDARNSMAGRQPLQPANSDSAIEKQISVTRPDRILSIDVFRGLTMIVMIFVNQLGEMRGLPWWTYHMPADVNGMTYVDVVFPFFLFIVGMSIPLAVRRRLALGGSVFAVFLHVALRALALVVLGLVLANSSKVDAGHTGISANRWTFLSLCGAMLFWNTYPASQRHKNVFRGMKYAGLLLLVAMLAIFRRVNSSGNVAWLDTSYWEILGMIGWTYFNVCLLYIPTRRWPRMQWVWLLALVLLNIACTMHMLEWPYRARVYLWPFKSGALSSITMAGVVTSLLFLSEGPGRSRMSRTSKALLFAAALLVSGIITLPQGISKVHATPAWCLLCSSAAVCVFLALYWICDVRKRVQWAALIRPAGSNTLLTYLLPPVCASIIGREVFLIRWDHGWQACLQAICFTCLILAVAAVLTRCRIRIQI